MTFGFPVFCRTSDFGSGNNQVSWRLRAPRLIMHSRDSDAGPVSSDRSAAFSETCLARDKTPFLDDVGKANHLIKRHSVNVACSFLHTPKVSSCAR
jgi:hypothetical protein